MQHAAVLVELRTALRTAMLVVRITSRSNSVSRKQAVPSQSQSIQRATVAGSDFTSLSLVTSGDRACIGCLSITTINKTAESRVYQQTFLTTVTHLTENMLHGAGFKL